VRIATILGTRPEIIRLSRLIPRLDAVCDHTLIHTGQNFDDRLSRLFFDELGLREPDHHLGIRATGFGAQAAAILEGTEALLTRLRPDRVLILGDTNSGLAALVARRLGIAVYHMEAGNRCWDDRVPEEINRRVIDHSSSVLMPYTERSRQNLLDEGIASRDIYVTGNPIKEVLDHHQDAVAASGVLATLGLREREFFLVTLHRAENVDAPARLAQFVDALRQAGARWRWPVVVSLHPRTAARARECGMDLEQAGLRLCPPFGFFDFVRLEREAGCVLTDSGTVQEETCLLGVPNVTLRDTTERPETLECGSNILTGADPQRILAGIELALESRGAWTPPVEYRTSNVAEVVCRILLSVRGQAGGPCGSRW
jgi:UDP-N-acetylglucosamine 2-epimerase (non-hydrolysing)